MRTQELSARFFILLQQKQSAKNSQHNWQMSSMMSYSGERVKPRHPLPASTTPLMQQIAVTLAVCSGPLAQKRGGHFGYVRWNQHYIAWTSAKRGKSASFECCLPTVRLKCRKTEHHKAQQLTQCRVCWTVRFGQMGGRKWSAAKERKWSNCRLDWFAVWEKLFSQLAGSYLYRNITHTRVQTCAKTHANAQIDKQRISPTCRMKHIAYLFSQICKYTCRKKNKTKTQTVCWLW